MNATIENYCFRIIKRVTRLRIVRMVSKIIRELSQLLFLLNDTFVLLDGFSQWQNPALHILRSDVIDERDLKSYKWMKERERKNERD